jgi:type II secretory pathway pseudopilin PulG
MRGGSPESKFIIALVIVAVVLAAIAFSLFAANQSQDKALKDKQAELDSIGANLSQVTADFDALYQNFADINGQFTTIKANYENVTQQYLALQNKSTTVDTRLNSFLENDLTIAYTYKTEPKLLPDNTTDQVITITAYNLGKFVVPAIWAGVV